MYLVIVDCKHKYQRSRDKCFSVCFGENICSLVSVFLPGFHWVFILIDIRVRGEWSSVYPTRLETRTKESNMYASHWVLRNLKAK